MISVNNEVDLVVFLSEVTEGRWDCYSPVNIKSFSLDQFIMNIKLSEVFISEDCCVTLKRVVTFITHM